jgi:hypothetical protein
MVMKQLLLAGVGVAAMAADMPMLMKAPAYAPPKPESALAGSAQI